MAHPRATFPAKIIDEYRGNSLLMLSRSYRSNRDTIRRWLIEHGVELRKQGVRVRHR